jgi:hypothetical protein
VNVFLSAPGDPEPDFESDPIASINLAEGGTYFFLYPHLLRIRDETGQLIENCGYARFDPAQLDRALHHLSAAREAAHLKPESFEQHVGRQITPVHQERYETIKRSEILDTIDQLADAFRKAKNLGMHVYCVRK